MARWSIKLKILTQEQFSAITGSLLGDGSLSICDCYGCKNSSFRKSQSVKRRSYINSLHELMKPYSKDKYEKYIEGGPHYRHNKSIQIFMYTVRHPIFTDLRRKWYENGTKIVPSDLILTPEIIAWWFCDDGTNRWKHNNAHFYSQSFTESENEFLVKQ